MATKPRSDSTLDSLSPEVKEQLRERLIGENMSYADAKEWLHQDFNVRTSIGALSRFYATRCFASRSSEAREFAEQVRKDLEEGGSKFDEATNALITQKAFELSYARKCSIEDLAVLAKIRGDSAKLKLKERELSISEEAMKLKLRQYEEKISAARDSLERAKTKGGLDKSTLQLIEEQLKLL